MGDTKNDTSKDNAGNYSNYGSNKKCYVNERITKSRDKNTVPTREESNTSYEDLDNSRITIIKKLSEKFKK